VQLIKLQNRVPSHWRMLNVLLALFLISTSLATEAPFTGAFEGTGRACYGGLYVRTKTISWLTPFSQCQKIRYEILEHEKKGNGRRFVFHLKQQQRSCRFEVLYLYHGDTPNRAIDWHVIGYALMTDYQADKQKGFKADSPNAQSCSLVTR
jgi:hypothetical protein